MQRPKSFIGMSRLLKLWPLKRYVRQSVRSVMSLLAGILLLNFKLSFSFICVCSSQGRR